MSHFARFVRAACAVRTTSRRDVARLGISYAARADEFKFFCAQFATSFLERDVLKRGCVSRRDVSRRDVSQMSVSRRDVSQTSVSRCCGSRFAHSRVPDSRAPDSRLSRSELTTSVDAAPRFAGSRNALHSLFALLAICCGFVAFVAPRNAVAQESAIKWRTGLEFRQNCDEEIGFSWSGNPLRAALGRLSRERRVAMFLDRRVDPDQRMTFKVSDLSLEEAAERLADHLNIGVARVGPVIYFGPKDATSKVATVAAVRRAELTKALAGRTSRLQNSQPLRWPELSEPRELVRQLLREVNAKFDDDELVRLIPHDLWPAVDLPEMNWSDRLSLVLAGFDLTYALDFGAGRVTLAPMPDSIEFENNYAVKGTPARIVADLTTKVPNAKIKAQSGKINVVGPYESHELVERLLRGESVRRAQARTVLKTYTIKIENEPLGGVLRAIAQQLMIEFEFAPGTQEALQKRVTFEVDMVSLEDLIAAALRGSDLKYKIEPKRLQILAP